MSLGMMASQAVAKALPEGAQVQKWKVFQTIREARELIGATDRALAILNALLHQTYQAIVGRLPRSARRFLRVRHGLLPTSSDSAEIGGSGIDLGFTSRW